MRLSRILRGVQVCEVSQVVGGQPVTRKPSRAAQGKAAA